jgi:hypothetical protein
MSFVDIAPAFTASLARPGYLPDENRLYSSNSGLQFVEDLKDLRYQGDSID